MSDLVERLRGPIKHPQQSVTLRLEAADMIERLRSRCDAYKGQVKAGGAEIERLRVALEILADQTSGDPILNHTRSDAMASFARAALSDNRAGEE